MRCSVGTFFIVTICAWLLQCCAHRPASRAFAEQPEALGFQLGRDGFVAIKAALGDSESFVCEEHSQCICYVRRQPFTSSIVFVSSEVAGSGTVLSGVKISKDSANEHCSTLAEGASPDIDGLRVGNSSSAVARAWGMSIPEDAFSAVREDTWESVETTPAGDEEVMTTYLKRHVRIDSNGKVSSAAAYYLEVF